jgi:hypothetical protein
MKGVMSIESCIPDVVVSIVQSLSGEIRQHSITFHDGFTPLRGSTFDFPP